MRSVFLSVAFILIIPQVNFGQDSTKVESTLNIETKGTGIWVSGRQNIECITCLFNHVRDNPFHHFAIYSGITHTLSVNDAFHFETGVFLEERSFSGGNNTLANWVVYPKIVLTGTDTLNLFNQKIEYKLSGGDFWNQDFDDMLRIYNLDYQGLLSELRVKNHAIGFLLIGDLSRNVGLGLHQYHKFFVRSSFGMVQNTLHFTENQLSIGDNHSVPIDYNLGNTIKIRFAENAKFESQIEWRINQDLGNSFAGGIGIAGCFKNLKYRSRLKYYEANFNLGYFSNNNLYRGSTSYVGEQLYPLKNFYRRYDQWGAYTSLQNNKLLGFELCVSWERNILGKMLYFADLDLNVIGNPQTRRGRTIPLYTTGLRIKYFNFLKTEFYFTNKHMNLDTFYQTFQASKMPFFGGSILMDLKRIELKSWKLPAR